MADTAGQALIRGIDIDKMAKNYEEEALIFKGLVNVTKTSARENRWYQKTSGYLTATLPAKIGPVAEGARPFVLETSWTRNTSYVKKYMLETPMINLEDESDSEVKVFLDNLKDVVEAIAYEVDNDIWEVASEGQTPTNINAVTATAGWDAASGQDPFEDIMEAKMKIRQETKRKLNGGYLLLNAKAEKDLLVWLVSTKGASIPMFSSDKIVDGVLQSIAGLRVIVSENVTADYAMVAGLKQAVEYKQFKPLTTAIIKEDLIGRKVRASEHGIAILERPKFISLISGIVA